MVDRRKAAPNPRNHWSLRRDYPQGKQRKETGLAGKWGVSGHLGAFAPAGHSPGIPRHVGISGKKKGLETIQALGIGGPEEDRTPDLCIANAALSQLSYRPKCKKRQGLSLDTILLRHPSFQPC
jgi:hypothetical protein